MRKALILPIAATALVALSIVLVLIFRYIVSPVSADPTPIPFTIAKGEAVGKIADDLEKAGLIHSALAYRIFVRVSGFETKIQAGNFSIPRNLSMKDLTYWIARGTDDRTITILEGWRIEEIAEYLDSKKVISKEEFLESAGSGAFDDDFLPQYPGGLDKPYRRLEGYLFPDTYQISAQSSAEKIIVAMLKNFGMRVTPEIRADVAKNNLSLHQAVTLASIVEREAISSSDRAIVAGIFIKRLNTSGWRLESDVTVQFLLGYEEKNKTWWRKDLTQDDLAIDSPYNTRKKDGLPPTPVDNPGLSSITAVARPQTSDFWFFLADKDGKIHFARTVEEHNSNVAKYLR